MTLPAYLAVFFLLGFIPTVLVSIGPALVVVAGIIGVIVGLAFVFPSGFGFVVGWLFIVILGYFHVFTLSLASGFVLGHLAHQKTQSRADLRLASLGITILSTVLLVYLLGTNDRAIAKEKQAILEAATEFVSQNESIRAVTGAIERVGEIRTMEKVIVDGQYEIAAFTFFVTGSKAEATVEVQVSGPRTSPIFSVGEIQTIR